MLSRWSRVGSKLSYSRWTSLGRCYSSAIPHLYDSLSEGTRELPHKEGYTSWYSCGPTVYDDAHIGHARNYVCLDTVQRVLKDYFGLNLWTAMGVTDVDDKIIRRARELGVNWRDLAATYEDRFHRDMGRLNVTPSLSVVRVSETIPEIIDFVRVGNRGEEEGTAVNERL